jgi:hypothetical protein
MPTLKTSLGEQADDFVGRAQCCDSNTRWLSPSHLDLIADQSRRK